MFCRNSKPSKRTLFYKEKKQNFFAVYKVGSWEVKIRSKEHPNS
jgi:hypothetical protein